MQTAVWELRLQKSERDVFSFEISPPAFRFSKTRFGPGSQLIAISDHLVTASGTRAPQHYCHHIRCKSFLVPSISIQFPERSASPVAGSPDGLCRPSPTGRFLLR